MGMGVAVGPLGMAGVGVVPVPIQDGSLIRDNWQPVLLKTKRTTKTTMPTR
jgi:hypothetical protein